MKKHFSIILFALTFACTLSANNNQDALAGIDLNEIVITGSRDQSPVSEIPSTVSVIDSEDIESRFEPSLLTILNEQIPGFFSTSRSVMGYGISTGAAGGINIRGIGGTNSAQMLVLIDGHPQYAGLMGHPIADLYQATMAKRIEIVRGPSSVLYGSNAMGGTMNIITGSPAYHGFNGSATVAYGLHNSLQSNIATSYSKDKLKAHASVIYNQSNGHRENMHYNQLQGNLGMSYRISDSYSVSVQSNIAEIYSENPGTVQSPLVNNKADIIRGNVSASFSNSFNKASGAVMLFSNFGNHTIDDGNAIGATPLTYSFRSKDALSGISFYETFHIVNGNKTTVGFDYFNVYGKGWFAHDDGTISSPWSKALPAVEEKSNEVAGYINVNQKLFNRITLNAGIRYNHHSIIGNKWIPQTGITYTPNSNHNFKLVVSEGYRNPTMKDMFLFPPQNPDLKPEELTNYEISYSGLYLDSKLSFDISLFYIDANNIITIEMVDGKKRNMNSGELKNSGIELESKYRITDHLSASANYSYLNMKNPVLSAPEHKLYAEIDLLKNRSRFTTGVQYVAGLYTDITPGNIQQEQYVLWNARYSFIINKNISLYIKGENLLNSKYETLSGYPMPGATAMCGIKINL